jgi:hypothetical protein
MGRSGSLSGGRPVVREIRRGRPGGGGGCDMEKNWLKGRFRRRSCHDLAASFSHESNVSGHDPHTHTPACHKGTDKHKSNDEEQPFQYRLRFDISRVNYLIPIECSLIYIL